MRVKNSKDLKFYLQEMFLSKSDREICNEDVLHAAMGLPPIEHLKTFSLCFDAVLVRIESFFK